MQRRIILSVTVLTTLFVAGYITLARVSRTRGPGFATSASSSHTQGALQVVDPEKES